ncbi:e3 ubiquitin-protein ligase rha2a [Fagus crenata]
MFNNLILIAFHLKWACNYLLYHSFSKHYYQHDLPEISEEASIARFKCKPEVTEDIECAVCLCKIEEGEEIRELRCEHLFHRDCLDRWLGSKRATCPLCRGSLAARNTTVTELGVEVLHFKFCSFNSDTDTVRHGGYDKSLLNPVIYIYIYIYIW